MRQTLMVGLLALAVGYIAGCGATVGGRTVMKFEKGDNAQTMPAPEAGQYALYGLTDSTAKRTVALKLGDKLGFEKGDGGIWAVGGDQKFGPYTDRSLMWKKVK
jgi:hypothetical protein